MDLCKKCQNLAISDAIQRTLAGEAESSYYGSFILLGDWHKGIRIIHELSTTCGLCALVIKAWRLERPIAVKEKLRSGEMPRSMMPEDLNYDVVDVEPYKNGKVTVSLQQYTDRANDGRHSAEFFLNVAIEVTGSRTSWDTYEKLEASFRISNGDGVATGAVQDILVQREPLSHRAVEIARTWVENCSNKHKSCVTNPDRLPTRLIDLRDAASAGQVFLSETGGSISDGDNRYIALSHCWGGGETICTTRSNLASHKDGIAIPRLPKSFRDGIEVALRLGMRYIWIDSLCIIQDDVNDWQKEAAAMAMVYRDAYLVLAASRGSADSEGFLGIRERPDIVKLSSFSLQPLEGLVVQLQPPKSRDRAVWTTAEPQAHEPLSMRAWCLQERYLARRVLFYSSKQMIWECQEVGAAEDGQAYTIEGGGPLEKIRETANISASLLHRASRERLDVDKGVNDVDWYKMVADYTNRAITKGSDRLPALSGLANATAQSSKDVYFAGLWKGSLMEGLAWCGRQGAGSLGRHDDYIAPSWSWASVVGPVQFPLYQWYDRAQWASNMADFEPLATYIGHEFQLRDQDPNGRLNGGWLRMSAALWPISAIEPRQVEDPDITPSYYFGNAPERSPLTDKTICARYTRNRKTTQIWLEGGFDILPKEGEQSPSRNLFIMFLVRLPFILENGFLEYRFGVIVEKVGHGATYRRVGFVDGFILSKVHSSIMRKLMSFAESEGAEAFGIQGFRRPLREGDLHDTERLNDLASDPFAAVNFAEITLV